MTMNVNELEAMRQLDTPEPVFELVILETKQDLATKIKAEHQSLMEAGRQTLEHALALGDLLNEAKRVGDGPLSLNDLSVRFEADPFTCRDAKGA
jgi:hypothetical protein